MGKVHRPLANGRSRAECEGNGQCLWYAQLQAYTPTLGFEKVKGIIFIVSRRGITLFFLEAYVCLCVRVLHHNKPIFLR